MPSEAQTFLADPLAGYATEDEMAIIRKKTKRTLRAERQRGDGPPYVKDGKRTYYSVAGFRDYLKAKERQPVRGPAAKSAGSPKPRPREGGRAPP
jgi:hypothetical protein